MSYERPRKLYIVGHSLGAGIANLTATYYLLHHNWKVLPQSLVVVTAGSPRSICTSMKQITDEKREEFGPKNVRFYRLVKGSDIVTSVPPKILGYEHMVEPTVITDAGEVVLRVANGDDETDVMQLFSTLKSEKDLLDEKNKTSTKNLDGAEDDTEEESEEEDETEAQAKYNNFVAKIPKALRDHMPDFYLKPLFKVKGITVGSQRQVEPDENDVIDEVEEEEEDGDETVEESAEEKRNKQRTWVPKVFKRKKQPEQSVSTIYF